MGLARGGRALPSDHHGSPTLGGARSAYSGECAGIATESGIGGQYVTHVLDQVGLLKTGCGHLGSAVERHLWRKAVSRGLAEPLTALGS